uniref:Uncharacterized protein n=1 Tax=Trypanosoma congolense (strain IL3000) TaxID=1068625 RepID=G0V1N2_TRYCI|nr:hypothetical protein, unlikely [Trypanosoma congolense IL3000]
MPRNSRLCNTYRNAPDQRKNTSRTHTQKEGETHSKEKNGKTSSRETPSMHSLPPFYRALHYPHPSTRHTHKPGAVRAAPRTKPLFGTLQPPCFSYTPWMLRNSLGCVSSKRVKCKTDNGGERKISKQTKTRSK